VHGTKKNLSTGFQNERYPSGRRGTAHQLGETSRKNLFELKNTFIPSKTNPMEMPSTLLPYLLGLIFLLIALLYSSVGQGGASGYLAVMALAGLSPSVMRPAALSLNVVVTLLGTFLYWRAGLIRWKLLFLLVLPSAPAAFLGAMVNLPEGIYRELIGLVLLYAAWKTLCWGAKDRAHLHPPDIPLSLAVMTGAGIGFLSGLTGVGGGIFLTPLLILAGWTDTRHAAGISSAFILINSIAGLMGLGVSDSILTWPLLGWMLSVCMGAFIGSLLGANRLSPLIQSRLLALVLFIAGIKMLLY